MSTTAGYFDETALQNIRIMADKIFFDDRIKQQFIGHTEVVTALQKLQTANFTVQKAKEKDYVVDVEWVNTCGLETQSIGGCDFTCNKSSTNVQTYHFNIEREVEFCVDEADLVDNDTTNEEHIAKLFLRADKLLSEWFAQQCVAYLDTFLGVNMIDGGKGTVVGNLTYIAAALWGASLMPYFQRVGVGNNFTEPSFISGQNLYEQFWLANYNAGNDNGKGDNAMFNAMNVAFDLRNIDVVNDPFLISYMISMGAVALVNKAYYTPQVQVFHDESRYSVESKNIPGFEFDVHYRNQCSTANSNRMQHLFKMRLKAGIYNNPEGCDEHNTGVLAFICGTP